MEGRIFVFSGDRGSVLLPRPLSALQLGARRRPRFAIGNLSLISELANSIAARLPGSIFRRPRRFFRRGRRLQPLKQRIEHRFHSLQSAVDIVGGAICRSDAGLAASRSVALRRFARIRAGPRSSSNHGFSGDWMQLDWNQRAGRVPNRDLSAHLAMYVHCAKAENASEDSRADLSTASNGMISGSGPTASGVCFLAGRQGSARNRVTPRIYRPWRIS
ncbi:MAG: hypothetical protein WA150_01865 [Methylovirgula sp.]